MRQSIILHLSSFTAEEEGEEEFICHLTKQ